MATFNALELAQQDNAKRPRLTEQVHKFKCACIHLSGIYCLFCKGKDTNCAVCRCTCEVGPMSLSDFEAISRHSQAVKLGISEDAEGVRTVSENRAHFSEIMRHSLEVREYDVIVSLISCIAT